MRFPKIVRNDKTKIEVTIYGKSKGGEPKKGGGVTLAYPFYRVCWRVAGQRRMQSFSSYSEAKRKADELVKDLGKGSQVTALTPGQANDALASFERLEGFYRTTGRRLSLLAGISAHCEALGKLAKSGHSLNEAIDGFLSTVASVKRMDISEAAEQFIEVRRPLTVARDGKRPQLSSGYTYNVNMWLREFANCFPGNAVSDLTREHLTLYFSKFSELSPKSRNERRNVVRMFLKWCERQDYIRANHRLLEADCMAREVAEPEDITFYTADELRAMLKNADAQLRPIIALIALGGVRLQEAVRLTWEDVFHVPGHVEITSGKSKTRARRLVTVCPALKAWLAPYRTLSGPVWTQCVDKFHSDFNALIGSLKIPSRRNGLRHGFVSYHFAQNANENLTASLAGTSAAMVHGHYKGLVTRKQAAAWFGVKPTKAGNILSLAVAR